ncbi:biopolymer transporter ExbD [Erythrobacter aquimaris]|uniref:Biopolymer transporter ExbD n=1 Tax=Qipengyuania aquimaris TaxID=255984 RepID=A0A6I4TPZ4_9SPHN|nr:biopolymer transporter ExbD [Qipengyuania aquimaris]MXO97027.1 biopolymer transporter ExbD [Qipengyuania aquimaris]
MPYPARARQNAGRPLSDLNITPLIDVMLVLLIMFILAIPIAAHALQVPLPTGGPSNPIEETNVVHIDASDRLFWNGAEMDRQDLLNQLAGVAAMDSQAVVRFDPDGRASYATSARTLALIKDSGVENFAFVGNERYRDFARAR